MVAESQTIDTTIAGDDDAMLTARPRLHDQQWLTRISTGRLTAEAGRIDRAREAVATARSAARDYVQFGGVLPGYYQALIGLDTMVGRAHHHDLVRNTGADQALEGYAAAVLGVSECSRL